MQNDLFEKAPVHKAYFSFALPVVFSMVISLIYNMADTYFIAGTGNTNLVAGVSLGFPDYLDRRKMKMERDSAFSASMERLSVV